MIIKVCGMGEKENIRQLIDRVSPDLMGMIFYNPSPRVVKIERSGLGFYKDLQVPKVGVFVDADFENILQKINDFALDYVQLHGNESVEYVAGLKKLTPIKIIKVIRVAKDVDWQKIMPFEPLIDLFLFDTETKEFGGSGMQFNWSVLESYPFQKGFLLSGGVDQKSINTISALAFKVPQLAGVDINSKFENRPGIKEVEKVRDFVKEMRNKTV